MPLLSAEDVLQLRIEDAGLNATQPSEQLLLDGWLLRFNPGAAKRARSVNPVAAGRLPLDDKISACLRIYREHRMPPLFRITPYSQPAGLDVALAARQFALADLSRVMAAPLTTPPQLVRPSAWLREVDAESFARHVGALRGASASAVKAHARRLATSPLQSGTVRLVATAVGEAIGAGQVVVQGDLAGVYDVITGEAMRGRGLGTTIIQALLTVAHARGARTAYLQVAADNQDARRIYARFGFTDRYAYWYRVADGA